MMMSRWTICICRDSRDHVDVFGENLNLLDDAGRKLLGLFLRKALPLALATRSRSTRRRTMSTYADYLKLELHDYGQCVYPH